MLISFLRGLQKGYAAAKNEDNWTL